MIVAITNFQDKKINKILPTFSYELKKLNQRTLLVFGTKQKETF